MSSDAQLQRLLRSLTTGRVSRRQFIVRAAGLGLSTSAIAAFLAACGGASSPTAGATTASNATTAAPTSGANASSGAAPTAATSAGTPVNGGELKIATTTEGTTLHPYKYTDTPSGAYIDLMFLLP